MKALKTVWNVITTVLVAAVVVLAILLVGVRVTGLTPYVVLSGSMEPTYHTGSLIYVKKVDPFTIEPGTPITFMMSEDVIATHRVVGVVPDEEDSTVIRFRTKGDANDAEDVVATKRCLRALATGAEEVVLDCGESGSRQNTSIRAPVGL